MQNKGFKKMLIATIIYLIVAIFIIGIIALISINLGKEKFLMATNLIDMVTIDDETPSNIKLPVLQTFEDEGTQATVLLNAPDYGQNYATLVIPSIDVNLPIYYGKTLDLLKKGVGHDNDTYFPGEGGSIILMGHNYGDFLPKLPDAQIGDEIQIQTNYGDFSYTIYDTKVVYETETDKLPINDDEEILMIYTCWPINNIGYATQRYVVYAK